MSTPISTSSSSRVEFISLKESNKIAQKNFYNSMIERASTGGDLVQQQFASKIIRATRYIPRTIRGGVAVGSVSYALYKGDLSKIFKKK